MPAGPLREVAVFGGGRFWAIQRLVDDYLQELGALLESSVGFMSTEPEANLDDNLTYGEISSGDLGHVEVVQVHYDAHKVSYEQLCQFFFSVHDPTTWGQQGEDMGAKYSSTIFTHNQKQKATAQNVKEKVLAMVQSDKLKCYQETYVTTEIHPAETFTLAKLEDQKYLKSAENLKTFFKWEDIEPK